MSGVPVQAPLRTRALLLSGQVDVARLSAAGSEVLGAVAVPEPAIEVGGPASVGNGSAGRALISEHAAAGGCGRLQIVRIGEEDVVLALSASDRQLDLRSVYLLLGAVMQAYFDRFRAADYPPLDDVARRTLRWDVAPPPGRLSAWQRRVARWPDGPKAVDGPGARHTARLVLDEQRWDRLRNVAPHSGNTASIAVIALLTWWFRTRAPRPRAPVYATTLDLRDYGGLGTVLGPLTDRIVFEVDESGLGALTFVELVRRTHVGLLDAVVRYVPFGRLPVPTRAPGVRDPWDVVVHYCRTPPSSARTRGNDSLAAHGMSIELFGEAEFAAADLGHDPAASLELDITEAPDGVAVLLDADVRVLTTAQLDAMVADLDALSRAVAADPEVPMARLARR